MVGFIYDFIGRPQNDGDDRDEPAVERSEAANPKKSDNSAGSDRP
jgi:hypothetical protein